jgi:hypothetical protein
MSAIKAALAIIDVLELGEKINYTEISNQYGVVRSRLTRRHQRLSTTRELEGQNRISGAERGMVSSHLLFRFSTRHKPACIYGHVGARVYPARWL